MKIQKDNDDYHVEFAYLFSQVNGVYIFAVKKVPQGTTEQFERTLTI